MALSGTAAALIAAALTCAAQAQDADTAPAALRAASALEARPLPAECGPRLSTPAAASLPECAAPSAAGASWSREQRLQLWSVVGTWAAGIGTFLAVWVALSGSRVRLRVRAELVEPSAANGLDQNVLVVEVVNRGERPVTITDFHWQAGFGKDRAYISQGQNPNAPGDHCPKRLDPGEHAHFQVRSVDDWVARMAAEFQGGSKKRWLSLLAVRVETSVGKAAVARLGQPLRELVKARLA